MGQLTKDHYPVEKVKNALQSETGNPISTKMVSAPNMPTITLEARRPGKMGTMSPNSGKPLREHYDPVMNPEVNQRTKFINKSGTE